MIRFNALWARHLLFTLCFTFVLGVAPTQAQTRCGPVRWGSVRYVHEDVNVYSERSTDATVRLRLPKGQCVRADFLRAGWFAVFLSAEEERSEERALGYVEEIRLLTEPPAAVEPQKAAPRRCCRVCRTGKACGNSCIARNRTCHQPPGCACNGEIADQVSFALRLAWQVSEPLFSIGGSCDAMEQSSPWGRYWLWYPLTAT